MPRNLLDGLVVGIDHIGICVNGIDERAPTWADLLGLPLAHREVVAPQRTEACFIDPPDGAATVELIAPVEGNAGLHRFLEKRGEGLHHVAFAVRDIREALARLAAAEVPLIDQQPRPGARGHLVAFLHPKATGGTLVELVEHHPAT